MKQQIKYEIFTEDKHELAHIVAQYYEAFTITHNLGYWKHCAENSTTITLVLDDVPGSYNGIKLLANEIKRVNKQEAVLVVRSFIETELV